MQVLVLFKSGRPYNLSASIAVHGFIQRGYAICPFVVNEIDRLTFNRKTVVVGGVGTYQRIFPKLGVDWESESYPEPLSGYLGRSVRKLTLADLEEAVASGPLFIKPVNDDKTFTGFVCKDRWDSRLLGFEANLPLIGSSVIQFKSEWRVYVLDGKIQNISRYRGQAELFPHARSIHDMIEAYGKAPIAYSLDVGVDESGRTLLVEVNEALALGNYGLAPALHAKMIAARWHELMGDLISANEEAQTTDSPSYVNEQ